MAEKKGGPPTDLDRLRKGGPPMDTEYEDDRYEVLRAERPELTVGRVVPVPGHPSPHAARDKTEEHDMRSGYGAPLHTQAPTGPTHEQGRGGRETLGQGADGGGLRLNAGKNRIELLPPEWLWALADVMTQGSKKYPARNWELGMDWSSMIGCIHRHLAKFQAGQRYDGPRFDKEAGTTGCHELAMIAWNALALMVYDLRGIGNNDLPHEDYEQLDLFRRVNADTSDLPERLDVIIPPEDREELPEEYDLRKGLTADVPISPESGDAS